MVEDQNIHDYLDEDYEDGDGTDKQKKKPFLIASQKKKCLSKKTFLALSCLHKRTTSNSRKSSSKS